MSEHIQPLLDRIRAEGLKKAEAEKEALLESARAEADKILENARKEADGIREKAEKDAEALQARGAAALEQAARDTLLQFRSELTRQAGATAQAAASAALESDALLHDLLRDLVSAREASGAITLEANGETGERLKNLLPALLRDLGKDDGFDVVLNPRAGGGFKLKFADSSAVFDLTGEAVAGWLSAWLRPELAEILKKSAGGD